MKKISIGNRPSEPCIKRPLADSIMKLFILFAFVSAIVGFALSSCDSQPAQSDSGQPSEKCEENAIRCNGGTKIESCKTGEWQTVSRCEINSRCDLPVTEDDNILCNEIPNTEFNKPDLRYFEGVYKELLQKDFFDPNWPGCLHLKQVFKDVAENKTDYSRSYLKNKIGLNEKDLRGYSRCFLQQLVNSIKISEKIFPPASEIESAETKITESDELLYYSIKLHTKSNNDSPFIIEFVLSNRVEELKSFKSRIITRLHSTLGLGFGFQFYPEGYGSLGSNTNIRKSFDDLINASHHFYLKDNFSHSADYCRKKEVTDFLLDTFTGLKKQADFLNCNDKCLQLINSAEGELAKLVIQTKTDKEIKLDDNARDVFSKTTPYLVCHTLLEKLSFNDTSLNTKTNNKPLLPELKAGSDTMLKVLKQVMGEDKFIDLLFAIADDSKNKWPAFASGFSLVKADTIDKLMKKHQSLRMDSPAILTILPYWMNKSSTSAIKYILDRIHDDTINAEKLFTIQHILSRTLTDESANYLLDELKKGNIASSALKNMLNNNKYDNKTVEAITTSLDKLNKDSQIEVLVFLQSKLFLQKNQQPLELVLPVKNLLNTTDYFAVYRKAYRTLKQIDDINWRWPIRPIVLHKYVRADKADQNLDSYKAQSIEHLKDADEAMIIEIFNYAKILPDENLENLKKIMKDVSKDNPAVLSVCKRVVKMKAEKKLQPFAKKLLNNN